MVSDPVSLELRKIESEIDTAFQSNYLSSLDFSEAAWYLLSFAEDTMTIPLLDGNRVSKHNVSVAADRLLTHIQYPLQWLWSYCNKGGKIPYRYEEKAYTASIDLLDMATNYKSFVAAFVNASKGNISLSVSGQEIVADHEFLSDTRYEAYSHLLKPSRIRSSFNFEDIIDIVEKSVQVDGDRFSYKITPKKVEIAKIFLKPIYEEAFLLPREWEFSKYSLYQFFEFSSVLATLAVLHVSARYIASIHGCVGVGYVDGVIIYEYNELIVRMMRYSGLSKKIVRNIIEDMTFGNKKMRNPDPALQPLIPLGQNKIALAPWILLSSAIERNFTVLVNRLPSEKKIYAKLVNEKEENMRDAMIATLNNQQFRFYWGRIPYDNSLPDIDLAIISDVEKICLILELKWFIEPAEINEVITRSKDLAKGISQSTAIRNKVKENYKPLFDLLEIDTSYGVSFCVASANWIGFEDVQDENIPIINQHHLIEKVKYTLSLKKTVEWLQNRSYLPTEGTHYKIIDDTAEISGWNLKWYGIKPLIKGDYVDTNL